MQRLSWGVGLTLIDLFQILENYKNFWNSRYFLFNFVCLPFEPPVVCYNRKNCLGQWIFHNIAMKFLSIIFKSIICSFFRKRLSICILRCTIGKYIPNIDKSNPWPRAGHPEIISAHYRPPTTESPPPHVAGSKNSPNQIKLTKYVEIAAFSTVFKV